MMHSVSSTNNACILRSVLASHRASFPFDPFHPPKTWGLKVGCTQPWRGATRECDQTPLLGTWKLCSLSHAYHGVPAWDMRVQWQKQPRTRQTQPFLRNKLMPLKSILRSCSFSWEPIISFITLGRQFHHASERQLDEWLFIFKGDVFHALAA